MRATTRRTRRTKVVIFNDSVGGDAGSVRRVPLTFSVRQFSCEGRYFCSAMYTTKWLTRS